MGNIDQLFAKPDLDKEHGDVAETTIVYPDAVDDERGSIRIFHQSDQLALTTAPAHDELPWIWDDHPTLQALDDSSADLTFRTTVKTPHRCRKSGTGS